MPDLLGTGPDRAIRVTLPQEAAEVVGAVLMDRLGPFAEEPAPLGLGEADAPYVGLIFYPDRAGARRVSVAQVKRLLPRRPAAEGEIVIEAVEVPRNWVEGWKDHFRPVVVGAVRIRPPWETPAAADLVDVVINPGMGFGTGLHPTTRAVLGLLQLGPSPVCGGPAASGVDARGSGSLGPLIDAGTGSGILAIAAAKLGYSPIIAFDNDPAALAAARENVDANGVGAIVRLLEADVASVEIGAFAAATVAANLTLDPVLRLLDRIKEGVAPARILVSGILAGGQESMLLNAVTRSGLAVESTLREAEWIAVALLPDVEAG